MRAIRWHARGDVRLEDVPEPSGPGPVEVLIRVVLCGICGTDLEEFRRGPITIPTDKPHPRSGRMAPITLGHEVLGRVVATGSAVHGLSPGERVVLDANISCETCLSCRAGRRSLCEHVASVGLHLDGGLAEFLVIPASMCVPIPDHVPDRLAVLAEPLAVSVRAVRRAGLESTDSVLIIGAGTIGRCVLELAAGRGAAAGIIDPDPAKLLSATTSTPGLIVAPTAAEHPFAGAADIVIDCAGSEASLRDALGAVRPGGRVVLVGAAPAAPGFSPHALLSREVSVVTSLSHDLTDDTVTAVRLLASGRLSLDHLVTSVLSMTEAIERVFSDVAATTLGSKMVVDPTLGTAGPS